MQRADRDRWLALGLLAAVVALLYLVVVHPMTALGREMGLTAMTGFAKTAF